MWELPLYVNTALDVLEENGFVGYVVGGCVRDKIMGRKINDYDMTTSASVEDMKKIFSAYPQILAGEKHGTVAVVIDGEVLEITSFRADGEYADGRHPQSVRFVTSFKEDAARRYFTINSIGYSREEGYIDYYGGIDDIKNRIIRCVGDGEKRFDEDALRIMRAIRFSSQLGFSLEENTKKAAFSCAKNLTNISKERIFVELKKLLVGEHVEEVLNEYMGILAEVIPGIGNMIDYDQQNYHHNLTLSAHTAKVVANVPKDTTLRLTALFHDIAKPACATVDENSVKHFYGHPMAGADMAREILSLLRCDNKTIEDVYILIKEHDVDIPAEEKPVKRVLAKLGERLFFMLMDVKIADNLAQDPKFLRVEKFERIKSIAREIISNKECISLKDLKINGNDIINLGYSPSKRIGECLEYLLGMVIEDKLKNERELLICEAKNFMEK